MSSRIYYVLDLSKPHPVVFVKVPRISLEETLKDMTRAAKQPGTIVRVPDASTVYSMPHWSQVPEVDDPTLLSVLLNVPEWWEIEPNLGWRVPDIKDRR